MPGMAVARVRSGPAAGCLPASSRVSLALGGSGGHGAVCLTGLW